MVDRVFDAINQRDWEALSRLTGPDIEFHSTFAALEGGQVYRGIDQLIDLLKSMISTWAGLEWHLDQVRHSGDDSVLLYRVTGTSSGGGVPLEQRIAMIWTWSGDRPVRGVVYSGQSEALEAAGLSE